MRLPTYQQPLLVALLGAVGTVAWAYWSTLLEIGERWATDPQYAHGFLVPVFSLYLLWMRREQFRASECGPRWWGFGLVFLGLVARQLSHIYYQPWLDPSSLLLVLAGIVAATGGRSAVKWAGPAILFLAFVVPLPYRIQTAMSGTLQRVATAASTYILQTLGVPAVAEGNVILLSDAKLGVVEACNGLSMLVTFFALSTGVAILANRGWILRLLIVFSAVPIAVAANVVRISLTGVLFELHRGDWARVVFHDLAGWLMMPLALVLLLGELYVLQRAVVPVQDGAPAPRVANG